MKPKNFLPREEYLASLPRKRSGAGIILRNKQGEVLLVRPSYENHWSLPGGTIDANESPVTACIREAKEELGIDILPKRLLSVHYGKNEGEFYQFIFDGGVLSEDINITVDGDEILEAKFVNFSDTPKLMNEVHASLIKILVRTLNSKTFIYHEFMPKEDSGRGPLRREASQNDE